MPHFVPFLRDMEGELKGHLLIRPDSIEKGDCRIDRFEIKIVDGGLEGVEKFPYRFSLDMRLMVDITPLLYFLGRAKFITGRDVFKIQNPAMEKLEAFLATSIEVEDIIIRQLFPAPVYRAVIGTPAVIADLNIRALRKSHNLKQKLNTVLNPFLSFLHLGRDILDGK